MAASTGDVVNEDSAPKCGAPRSRSTQRPFPPRPFSIGDARAVCCVCLSGPTTREQKQCQLEAAHLEQEGFMMCSRGVGVRLIAEIPFASPDR